MKDTGMERKRKILVEYTVSTKEGKSEKSLCRENTNSMSSTKEKLENIRHIVPDIFAAGLSVFLFIIIIHLSYQRMTDLGRVI